MKSECPSAENTPEGMRDADLENILEDWEFLAAQAYQGFSERGEGTLIISLCEHDEVAHLSLPRRQRCLL